MKLNELELAKLLPVFMRDDKNFNGIIYAIEDEFKLLYEKTKMVALFKNIDILPDDILDELAWHFNVIEYNNEYPIETKRRLIKDCLSIHHKRGTVAAVEEVGKKIFGDARVEEWFDYEEEGEPYHFRVHTSNVSTSDEMIAEFRRVVVSTQNIRSWLDEIIAETVDEMPVYFGYAMFYYDTTEMSTVPFKSPAIAITDLFYVLDGKLYFNDESVNSLVLKDEETGIVYQCYNNKVGRTIKDGDMSFEIDDRGHLIYERTPNESADFYLQNGRLYQKAFSAQDDFHIEDGHLLYVGMKKNQVTFAEVDGDIKYLNMAQIYEKDTMNAYVMYISGGHVYYYPL